MRIDIACSACGRNRFSFPIEEGDEAIVTCDDCGHVIGTLGSMKEKVERAVLDRISEGKTGGDAGDG